MSPTASTDRVQNTNTAVDTSARGVAIDEDEEYIPPRANYPLVRVIEQGRYETMAMLRNGEQLMLNIIFPVMALLGAGPLRYLHSAVGSGHRDGL